MKVAIYSPYLDTLGGGEKYMLTIAETLSQKNQVDVLLDKNLEEKNDLKKTSSEHFGLDLSKVNFKNAPIGKGSSVYNRSRFLSKYDLFFYLTDGSIFIPTAKKNILHIQSPIVGQPAKSLWGRVKLKCWNLIIYNSKFTQDHSLKNWPLKSVVINPPVDTKKIKPLTKSKYILSVGRFFGYLKEKKHQVMIKAFKQFSKEIPGWSLHLVGSATQGDQGYIEELKKLSQGCDIYFHVNESFYNLRKLYGESSIYWHAMGYGEEDPTKMEHFGISTVEAMAAGCIPIVVNAGGQREIVDNNSGFLWSTADELKEFTIKLINDEKLLSKFSQNAQKRAEIFGKEYFEKEIQRITNDN